MAQILSLISGKGGSGKTTLSLSMAKLLSLCGLRVLVIDCDLATNGATYFFAAYYETEKIQTIGNIVRQEEHPILDIEENLFFIPTSVKFSEKKTYWKDGFEYIGNYILSCDKKFDIIICDCQAGYSELLEYIIPISTINLVTMEPDAISNAAIKTLYTQAASLIDNNRTYLIMTKITDEERDTYKNVVFGTMFTLLPSIEFNWDVRKAFAYSRLPALQTTDAEFGKNIYEIVKILFPNRQAQIVKYEQTILLHEKMELEQEIKMKNEKMQTYGTANKVFLIRQWIEPLTAFGFPAVALGMVVTAVLYQYNDIIANEKLWMAYLIFMPFIIGLCIFSALYIQYKRKRRELFYQIETEQRELERLRKRFHEIVETLGDGKKVESKRTHKP